MVALGEAKAGSTVVIGKVSGTDRFVSRITSIGLTEGCTVEVLQNVRKRPVLVYARDSVIAVDRGDCALIEVEAAL